jgi:hypothetical protein
MIHVPERSLAVWLQNETRNESNPDVPMPEFRRQ